MPGPTHRFFQAKCWLHGPALTDADFQTAARRLGCDVDAIKAVAKVETKRSPWFEIERPSILYERHYFKDLTGGIYDREYPDLSGPYQKKHGTYREQYDTIARAAALNEPAALKSASWGMFQIMGKNHAAAGHPTIEAFVDAMMLGEQQHLAAFVSFVASDSGRQRALRDHDWATFALRYNGSNYRDFDYDGQMATAYAGLTRQAHR